MLLFKASVGVIDFQTTFLIRKADTRIDSVSWAKVNNDTGEKYGPAQKTLCCPPGQAAFWQHKARWDRRIVIAVLLMLLPVYYLPFFRAGSFLAPLPGWSFVWLFSQQLASPLPPPFCST